MRFVRIREVERLTGLSKTSLRRLERQGTFPRRRQLSPGSVGWPEAEIFEWLAGRQPVQATEITKEQ